MQRPSLVEDAWSAFHYGDYPKSLDILARCEPSGARGRILLQLGLRQRDYKRVADAAAEMRALGTTLDERAIGEAYAFFALVAREDTNAELNLSTEHTKATTKAEIALVRANIAWMRGEKDLRRVLADNPPQTLDQRIRRISLEAWVQASGGNYRRQAELLLNALTRALDGGLDAGAIVILAHPLAVLLREIELGDLSAYAENLLRRVPWGRISVHDRYYGERALAWRRALEGEYVSALTHLDSAMSAAPDDLCRAVSHIDAARIAAASKATVHARASIELAFTAFERVDWSAAYREEPLGLFGSMDVLSCESERASALFQRAVRVNPTRALGLSHGPRLRAYRAFAESFVVESEAALTSALEAYETFRRCGYVFRATASALRAYDLSGKRIWLERASLAAERYPRSLQALELQQRSSLPNGLTERRLQVLRAVCSGRTSAEVASDLKLSESTVRKHIAALHRILGVTRRPELVRRALELHLAA